MDVILLFLVVIAAGFSIYNSFKARSYRKQGKFDLMNFYSSKGNIAMGVMLISMALIQLFAFGAETTGWRIGVGLLFLVIGLFNFIVGIRNYREFGAKLSSK